MRFVTVLVEPDDHSLVPVYDSMAEGAVTRDYLHHFNVLSDGTAVLLYRLRGDLDHARATFEASPDVLHHDVPEHGDGLAYVHCELSEPLRSLLSGLQNAEVIVDMPIEFLSGGRLRITFIGGAEPLRRVLDGTRELVDATLERSGEYDTESHRLRSLLTDRQREILVIAVELGYYEVPRRIGLRELADEVDVSVATVGEHLQKIEARILAHAVR